MKYRKLGSSDLSVSEISLGSWLTYSGGIGREQTAACTRTAYESGITLFDTANIYGKGASEEAWGEILSDYPRDSYVLATKLYFPMSDEDGGLSASQIHKQIDASLVRLRTDYVDLYQCHRFDGNTPIEETMEALSQVVRSGKVRYIGFSEWSPEQIQAGLSVAGTEKFVSSQPQYNMVWRNPEDAVFPLCAKHGISQIVWSPLAQGVLTGKYRPGSVPAADSRAASADLARIPEMAAHMDEYQGEGLLKAVQRLRPVAEGLGLTLAQLALAWVLRRSEVASAIIGASRPEQVVANAAASGVRLDAGVLSDIDSALAGQILRGTAKGSGTEILYRD